MFIVKFITHPLGAFVLGMAALYILFLILDKVSQTQTIEGEDKEELPLDGVKATSVVYPPGFEFLEEEVSEEPSQNLRDEVRKLVKVCERQTTETYRELHRLLRYSDKVTDFEEEAERNKLQLEDNLGRANEEIKNLREIRESQTIIINELENDVKNLKDGLSDKVSSLENVNKSLEFEKEASKESRESFDVKYSELENEKSKLQHEMEVLKNEHKEFSSQNKELKNEMESLQAEIEQYKEKLTSIEKEFEEKERMRTDATVDVRTQLSSGESQAVIENLNVENTALKKELDEYVKKLKNMETELKDIKSTGSSAGDTKESRGAPNANVVVIKTLQKENAELSEDLDKTREELEQMKEELEELEEVKDTTDNLQAKIDAEVEIETSILQGKIDRLEQEFSALRDAKGIKADSSEVSEDVEELQRALMKRDNEIAQLQEQIRELKKKTTNASMEREGEVTFLHEELTKKDDELSNMEEMEESLTTDIEDVKAEIEEEKERYRSLEEENQELQNRLERFLDSEDKLQIEMGVLEDKYNEEKNRVEELNKKTISLQEEAEENKKSFEDRIALFEMERNKREVSEIEIGKVTGDYQAGMEEKDLEIEELQEKVREYEEQKGEWRKDGDFLREKIGSLERKLNEAQDSTKRVEQLDEQAAKHEDMVFQLKDNIADKKEEITQLKKKIDEEKDEENRSLHEKMIPAEELVGSLQQRIKGLEHEARERTISQGETIICGRCFGEISTEDVELKKARRIEEKIFCKYCLSETDKEESPLEIEDGLEKIAKLTSDLRIKRNWNQYKEVEISEQLASLGKAYIPLLSEMIKAEKDQHVQQVLQHAVDSLRSGEPPEAVLIDDALERSAYLMQRLRSFPGAPDEGKGGDICRKLVQLGPVISDLLSGMIRNENNPKMQEVLRRIHTAINKKKSFDEV